MARRRFRSRRRFFAVAPRRRSRSRRFRSGGRLNIFGFRI